MAYSCVDEQVGLVLYLGDTCIQFFHLGKYIFGYTVGNLVLRRRVCIIFKQVWPGNATITYCRPAHGTVRKMKKHRQPQHKKHKTASSFLLGKMIAKQERVHRSTPKNTEDHIPHCWKSHVAAHFL